MSEIAEIMLWGGLIVAAISSLALWIDRQIQLRDRHDRLSD